MFSFSDFLYKSICCGYSFELHRQVELLVDAIQMGTHNICLYKEVDKKYTGCNLKTMGLLDCEFIGICTVIRSNTVYIFVISILLGWKKSLWSHMYDTEFLDIVEYIN